MKLIYIGTGFYDSHTDERGLVHDHETKTSQNPIVYTVEKAVAHYLSDPFSPEIMKCHAALLRCMNPEFPGLFDRLPGLKTYQNSWDDYLYLIVMDAITPPDAIKFGHLIDRHAHRSLNPSKRWVFNNEHPDQFSKDAFFLRWPHVMITHRETALGERGGFLSRPISDAWWVWVMRDTANKTPKTESDPWCVCFMLAFVALLKSRSPRILEAARYFQTQARLALPGGYGQARQNYGWPLSNPTVKALTNWHGEPA